MLEAVSTIHEKRIIHSDLKPANFLLVHGTLKLIDFGISMTIQSDHTSILRENPVNFLFFFLFFFFLFNQTFHSFFIFIFIFIQFLFFFLNRLEQ